MGDNGNAAIVGSPRPPVRRAAECLLGKQLKLVLRVTQVVNSGGAGIYRFSLIHEKDGRWRLAVEGDSRLEELGDS